MVKSFKRVPATWNGWPRTWSTHYKATYFPLFLPLFFSFSFLFLFFFFDYLHVSCPPTLTQSLLLLAIVVKSRNNPSFVVASQAFSRDECESFENSVKTNLFSFFLREGRLQIWLFLLEKIGTTGIAPRQKFACFFERGFRGKKFMVFFPKLKLKLLFFLSSSSH